jgi:Ca2+-binding EF-hand superfamily protein
MQKNKKNKKPRGMGGAVTVSRDLKDSVKELAAQRKLPSDASDIRDLQKGKEEILKLRSLCHQVKFANAGEIELLQSLEDLSPYSQEIRTQMEKPTDASDIEDIQIAKNEIIKLRNIWLSIKLSEADLASYLTMDVDTNPQESDLNPIIAFIKQKLNNDDALTYFRQHDTNGSGLIERNELRRFIRMQGVVYVDSDLESLIDRYDLNGDGKLAYGEFLKAFSQDAATIIESAETIASTVKLKINSPDTLTSFKQSDRDSSGTVDRGEMRRLLRINGIAYREEDFDSFFTLHDLSGDGKLNFEEFCLAMGYSPKIGA